jgi:hypothetical protein
MGDVSNVKDGEGQQLYLEVTLRPFTYMPGNALIGCGISGAKEYPLNTQ